MRKQSTMASTWSLLLVSLVTLISGDQQSCRDLGFSSSLLCSSCDELKEFSLSFLEKDCRRCCQRDKDDAVASKVNHPERCDSSTLCLVTNSMLLGVFESHF